MSRSVQDIAGGRHVLWGANWSLYSAKVRPYLIKKGIDYVELNPSHPHFTEQVLPHIGHFTVPVLQTPDGDIIADSTEIMEFLEKKYPATAMLPEDPALAAVAHLIHAYGSEGLTKPAMYLRWDTSYENRCFVRDEFARSLETRVQRDASGNAQGDAFAIAMRAYLPVLGMRNSDAVDAAVEASTTALYDCLNAHFLDYPYLLGGVPSLADYGMMGALYAHHGRDVSSSNAMKIRAPALYRWIETMGRAPIVDPEVWHVPERFFASTDLPATLISLLELIAADYVPELLATAELYRQWLEAEQRPAGAILDVEAAKRCHQVLGEIEHVQQDVVIHRVALLDSLTQHLRFQALVEQMDAADSANLMAILNDASAAEVGTLRLPRTMLRQDHAYVLA